MKTYITFNEGKVFPGFFHYKGKIKKKNISFSFRIGGESDKPCFLFIKKQRESIRIKYIPEFHSNQFSEIIQWIVDNFDMIKNTSK